MKRMTLCMAVALVGLTFVADSADARMRRGRLFGRRNADVVYSETDQGAYTIQGRSSMYPRSGEPIPAPGQLEGQTTTTGAVLDFVAPADAQIWVDGRLVQRTGDRYRFQSGPITTGRNQSFEVRAQWNDNGRVVNQTRNVSVGAGGNTKVDFTRPAPSK